MWFGGDNLAVDEADQRGPALGLGKLRRDYRKRIQALVRIGNHGLDPIAPPACRATLVKARKKTHPKVRCPNAAKRINRYWQPTQQPLHQWRRRHQLHSGMWRLSEQPNHRLCCR